MIKQLHLACLVLICLASSYLAGCSTAPRHGPSLEFKAAASPTVKGEFPNWQLPPHDLETTIYERALAGKLHTEEAKRTAHGTSGALFIVTNDEVSGKDIKWKFKKNVPGWVDFMNTSPRKELAAYEIQKFFLDPEDYVVPTALPICVPRERYLQAVGYAAATLEGTNCILGLASIWMVDVTIPDTLYDESRFPKDPSYAYYMSNFNILTYLIDHRDPREGQFLVSKDDKRRQVFSIDNGISFGFWPYNIFLRQWADIQLPALRQASIDRLRKIQRHDLDFLGVITQFKLDENLVLRPAPVGENLDPTKGAKYIDGTLQYGLSKSEIDDLWERIQTLIAEVDSGNIQVF
ncbi:MAG: hypothetical protein LJE89_09970 [Deltaproteobacteria bacterium]|nr:hypothetical protein [Deltaproteobacteria bacterium]